MRGRMNEGKSYVPQFEIGKPLEGGAVGRVIASQDEKLPVGTFVLSMYGWREAFVASVSSLRVIDTTLAPPSAYLGILGVTGLTAWVGLFTVAKLKDGETVFISAGAGAVGSAACQFAKMHNCRVIASASSNDKLAYLRGELKVDYAFNYRGGDPRDHLRDATPEGLNVYFDNTQGPQLEAALDALVPYGRLPCAAASRGITCLSPGRAISCILCVSACASKATSFQIISQNFLLSSPRRYPLSRQANWSTAKPLWTGSIQPLQHSSTFSIPVQETSAKWL